MKTSFKNIALVLCFATVLVFTSCNSDESQREKIVGSWTCTYDYIEYYSDIRENRFKGDVIIFREDQTCLTNGSRVLTDNPKIEPVAWSIIDDSLYIDGKKWYIEELTKNKLKVKDWKSDNNYEIIEFKK